jgi:DNA-binding GntR family transcriptional regulator
MTRAGSVRSLRPRTARGSSAADALEPSLLENRAHQALCDWLVDQNPAPGTPVPIREFARDLGMSRTPVRTAVGRLYERGLLDYTTGGGFTVAIPSPGSIYELFELRLMIESHSLRLHTDNGEPLPKRFRELLDEAKTLADEALTDEHRYIDFRRNDTEFHRAVVELAGLPRLCTLHEDLDFSIHVTRAGLEAPVTASRLQRAYREHVAIVEALEAGDDTLARERLEEHITRVRDQTIAFLSRPRAASRPRSR